MAKSFLIDQLNLKLLLLLNQLNPQHDQLDPQNQAPTRSA